MIEIRLAYASRARIRADSPEMDHIESASLRNNGRLGVTGGLYYDGVRFFQALEGPENAIALLYDTIRKDPRHEAIELVCRHPIEHRMFALWSMKFVSGVDDPQLRATFAAAAALTSPSAHSRDPRIEALQQA